MKTYTIYIRKDSGAINEPNSCSDYTSREAVLLDTLNLVHQELQVLYKLRHQKAIWEEGKNPL